MILRLLAPAGPVSSGRSAIVRASLARLPLADALATWDWDDGHREEAPIDRRSATHARRTHRYAEAGVYRVRVGVGGVGGDRYVAVRGPGQIAASGCVRDTEAGGSVPFGFLITPATTDTDDAIVARFLIGAEELVANRITWLLGREPGALHFGGTCSLGPAAGEHPYRIDVLTGPEPGRQHLALSVYAPGAVPGRDSPIRRISGPIRPGRMELDAARVAGMEPPGAP